jgi:oligosaccharide repeat unit polymerase
MNNHSTHKNTHKPELFLASQLLLMCILITVNALSDIFNLGREFSVYSNSVLIIISFSLAVWIWYRLVGNLFDPYILFVMSAMLFNGGQALIEIFGIKPSTIFDVYNKVQPTTVSSALFLVAVGFLSFQIGGTITAIKYAKMSFAKNEIKPDKINQISFGLRTVGLFLLLISIYPSFNQLKTTVDAVNSGGYWAVFQIDKGIGFEGSQKMLSLFLVPGILFLLAGSKRKTIFVLVTIIILFSYVAVQYFIGSRMLAAMPLLAYSWLWHKTIRPLPRIPLILIGATLLLVVFPLVSVYRTTTGDSRLNNPAMLYETFTSIENPAIAIVSEMASTIVTVGWTLELVPSIRPYAMGSSYWYSILSLIPNLFWKLHPTAANELGRWLSETVTPGFAALGGGWGYSFIAEAYLNFGWIGAPFILLAMGYLYSKFVVTVNYSEDIAKYALLASFSSFFYMFARGEFATMPRYLIWYSLFPFLLTKLMSIIRAAVHMKTNQKLLSRQGIRLN